MAIPAEMYFVAIVHGPSCIRTGNWVASAAKRWMEKTPSMPAYASEMSVARYDLTLRTNDSIAFRPQGHWPATVQVRAQFFSAYPRGSLLRLALPHELANERVLLRACHLNGRQDCDRAELVCTGIFYSVESRACAP